MARPERPHRVAAMAAPDNHAAGTPSQWNTRPPRAAIRIWTRWARTRRITVLVNERPILSRQMPMTRRGHAISACRCRPDVFSDVGSKRGRLLGHEPRQGLADATDRLFHIAGLAQIAQTQIPLACLSEGRARRQAHIRLVDEAEGDVLGALGTLDLQEG